MRDYSWLGRNLSLILFVLALVIPGVGAQSGSGPEIYLDSPMENGTYGDFIGVSGRIVPAPDSGLGEFGVDSIVWSVPELGISGYLMFHRSGRFNLSIPVDGYRDDLTLQLRATDGPGRTKEVERHLRWAEPVIQVIKPSDEALPADRIVIYSPADGDFYRSFVDVKGSVLGSPDILRWQVDALGSSGPVDYSSDGSFTFAFSTSGFSDPIDILITAEYPDKTDMILIHLLNSSDGPYLKLLSPVYRGYYLDSLNISGQVGKDPAGIDGIPDLKGLYWWFAGETGKRRPVFFDDQGLFSFDYDLSDQLNDITLILEAEDMNGNVSRREFLLFDGRLAPEVLVSTRVSDPQFGPAGFTARGQVNDPYESVNDYGGFKALNWTFRPSDARFYQQEIVGTAEIASDGSFDIPVFPGDLNQECELIIEVLGNNDSSGTSRTIFERGGSDIPSFSATGKDSRAELDWDAPPDVSGYSLEISDGSSYTIELNKENSSLVRDELVNGSLQAFRLVAHTPRGIFYSAERRVIPLSGTTLKPEPVSAFRQIHLSWKPISSAAEYRLYRRSDIETEQWDTGLLLTQPFYTDDNVRYGTEYYYAVAPAEFPWQTSDSAKATPLRAPEQKLEEVARYEGIVPDDILVERDYAFVAAGENGFRIIDISNPLKPRIIGETQSNDARGVAVLGDYAYLADGETGLQVINITEPANPIPVGSRLAGIPTGIAVRGSYAFVTDSERGLRVYNVTDARKPRRVAILEGFGALGLLINDSIAFIPAGTDGLAIVDISSPEEPVLMNLLAIGDARHVAAEGDLIIISDRLGAITLFRFAESGDLEHLSTLPAAGAGYLALKNGYIFAASLEGGLSVFDARDPFNVSFFEHTDLGFLGDMEFKDDYLYAGTPTGIIVIQTYLVGVSYESDQWDTPGKAHGISLYGNQLIVADHENGAIVYDESGTMLSEVDSEFAVAAAARGTTLGVADGVSGVHLFSQTEEEGGWLEFPHGFYAKEASDLAFYQSTLYFAVPDYGIRWFTASEDGQLPVDDGLSYIGVQKIALGNGILAAAAIDEVAIFSTGIDGVTGLVSRIDIPGVKDIAYSHPYLLTAGKSGFIVFDLTIPATPKQTSAFEVPHARSITVKDEWACISAGPDGLLIYNLSNPAKPFLASRCEEVFAVDAVLNTSAQIAYVVDITGVKVVDIVIPTWLR